jgi:hypothetical protein
VLVLLRTPIAPTTRKGVSLSEIILLVLGIHCNVSVTLRNTNHSARILFAVVLMAALILSSSFNGRISSILIAPEKDNDIRTIDELLATNYQLYSTINHESLVYVDNNTDKNSKLFKLVQRNIVMLDQKLLLNMIGKGKNIGVLFRDRIAKTILYSKINFKNGKAMYYRIEEPPVSIWLSYMVRKDSPFIDKFNQILLEASDHGFLQYGLEQEQWMTKLERIKRTSEMLTRNKNKKGLKKITMPMVMDYFAYWAIGLACALTVFIAEIIYFRVKKAYVCSKNRVIYKFCK